MAVHSPREKFFVFLVCLIVGAMISTQFRSAEQAKQSVNQQRAEDLVEKLKNAEKENKALANKLEEMETQGTGGDRKVLNDLKIKAGEVPLHGPGVLVVVNDSQVTPKAGENPNLYVIHDDDLLRLLNELRAAGAEALSVNQERLLDISEVRCAGPTVSVNNTRFTPPYEIRAIGDPKTLESALRLRGGVVETLKFWGITVDVKRKDDVVIPAYKGTRHFEYAKTEEGGKG
ncbi:DUF881 domain-containing protein [Acidaminococcus sp. LBK-2]|uniref:DUF881 domain-containing protein n=1 Tax=Acidaminococcus TaxID=904 RepID=UPI002432E151|nr:DUF881 domain-containing protein [Acidaminococcus fermentans]